MTLIYYYYKDQQAVDYLFVPESDIFRKKVEMALRSLKSGKSSEPDRISSEAIKVIGETGIIMLLKISQSIWDSRI